MIIVNQKGISVRQIPGIKKTTIMLTDEQNRWAKQMARKIKLHGGLGAYIRYLISCDIENFRKYGQ